MPDLTPERLREVLDYNRDTGVFVWAVPTNPRIKVGDVAGCVPERGYRLVRIDRHPYRAHRLAWLYVYGEWPAVQIDHINGDRADNRLANLREATGAENMQNQRRPQSNNQSGFLGVRPSGGRWRAAIMVGGRKRYLGCFGTPEKASEAYVAAKRELHPFSTITQEIQDAG